MLTEILGTTIGAVAGVLVTMVITTFRPPSEAILKGRPLAELENYPVAVGTDGKIRLDMAEMIAACNYLVSNREPRAAIDLLYLAEHNRDVISPPAALALDRVRRVYRRRYRRLVEPQQLGEQREHILRQFGKITDALGGTFSGLPIEFVLHDTRDPLNSIYTIKNSITGRREGDPVSVFGEDVVRAYGRRWSGPQVAYRLRQPTTGQIIKATTIPLEDKTLGLVAFLCVNIDVGRMSPESSELRDLAQQMVATPAGWGPQVFAVPD
ncbi:PAS domain-containing protein [Streptomyces sp. NBC_01334]|uniref:PAS domain-containing protein n=1 Tax=Streptomyces sp. NBC_01334 TaxID=2903827 RepID=UPI002E14D149|nr:PAS domain-containing protein [Streptomyces sp. NBC_01334]